MLKSRTITIGPFGIFFTNVNKTMGLPGHSHYAEVSITYLTLGETGFPAFEATYQIIREALREFTRHPFRDHTNERVADAIFDFIAQIKNPEADRWNGKYLLNSISLSVRGVLDHIGHADGFTTYTVTVPATLN